MAFRSLQKTLALSWSYFNGVLKTETLLGKQQTGRNIKRESTEKCKRPIAKDNIL